MTNAVYTSIAEQLRGGHTVTYFTVGVSMRPLLRERKTQVTVAPLKEAKDKDVLLYVRQNGMQVLHRLIRQEGERYYMRGDNTLGLECIAKEQAIGVVTHIYRNGREFDVSVSKAYRVYVRLWGMLYPCRWLLGQGKSAVRRLLCVKKP